MAEILELENIFAGTYIREVAKNATQLATENNRPVHFEFNGTHVIVQPGNSWNEVVERWSVDREAARDAYLASEQFDALKAVPPEWKQILVIDNCWRCGCTDDVRQAYNPKTSEYGSEPKCGKCRAVPPAPTVPDDLPEEWDGSFISLLHRDWKRKKDALIRAEATIAALLPYAQELACSFGEYNVCAKCKQRPHKENCELAKAISRATGKG